MSEQQVFWMCVGCHARLRTVEDERNDGDITHQYHPQPACSFWVGYQKRCADNTFMQAHVEETHN